MSVVRYQNNIMFARYDKQVMYDLAHPVGQIVIGLSKPVVPSGVVATWEDITSDYDNRALWVSSTDNAGKKLDGSLPNITGNLTSMGWGSQNTSKFFPNMTGCFVRTTHSINNGTTSKQTGGFRMDSLIFNASGSNDVYKAEAGKNVVRPTSTVVKVWKRVKKLDIVFLQPSGTVFSGTQQVDIVTSNSTKATYNIDGGTDVEFSGDTSVTISATSTINVTAYNGIESITSAATYTKVLAPTITFSPSGGTDYGTSGTSQIVTIKVENASASTYSLNAGTAVSFSASTQVTISGSTDYIKVEAENALCKVTDTAVYGYRGDLNKTVTLTLSDGTTSSVTYDDGTITDSAFSGDTSIVKVTMGSGITAIGAYCFKGCTNLTSITVGNGVKSIGNYFCSDNKQMTSCALNSGLKSIGIYCCSSCHSLTSFSIPDSVTGYARGMAAYSTGITAVKLSNNMTATGTYAFRGCTALKSLTVPDNHRTITQYTCCNGTSLTAVTMGKNVTTIETYAFSGCTALSSITISSGVTTIGDYAFAGMTACTSVNFNNTIAKWLTITRGTGSFQNIGTTEVLCTDGYAPISTT